MDSEQIVQTEDGEKNCLPLQGKASPGGGNDSLK